MNYENRIIESMRHIMKVPVLNQHEFLKKLSDIDNDNKFIKECKECKGKGTIIGRRGHNCRVCRCGKGYIFEWNNLNRLGFFKCKICNGYGRVVKSPSGNGYLGYYPCLKCDQSGILDWIEGLIK